MIENAVPVLENVATKKSGGGGITWYKPYIEVHRRDFKILWPHKEHWRPKELEAMVRLFGTGFIIVDEDGNELWRMP